MILKSSFDKKLLVNTYKMYKMTLEFIQKIKMIKKLVVIQTISINREEYLSYPMIF